MTVSVIDPRCRPYQPYGGALELFYAREDEILVEGPAGTGKSRSVLEKVHLCLMKYPGSRWLICRKTRASMTQSVLVTFEEKVLPEGSAIADGAHRSNRSSYSYPNGSELVVGGLDNPDRIMSTEYDGIAVFEATEATEDDWEKLGTRLRNARMPFQQQIADCNPSAPTHWLNQRANRGQMRRILSRHADNPTITEQYLRRLDRLTGARRARLRDGQWAAQEGLVYAFDRALHVIPRFEIPPEWRRIRVVDFGFTNPFVCQWWAIDGDERMYLYRQLYRTQTLVEDHARKIVDLSEGERIEATVADHDAEDRATLEAWGIPTLAAHKAISPGIQAVQARLAIAGDGRPRLYFLEDTLVERDEALMQRRRPVDTLEEFDSYQWPKGADGKEMKEAPVKVDDHGMDAMRYGVAYVDGLGREAMPDITWVEI